MSWRSKVENRCARCNLHRDICICQDLPHITTRCKLSFLLHPKELKRPTNTGRIAQLCLQNSEIYALVHGPDTRQDLYIPPPLERNEKTFILFPSDNSRTLDETFAKELTQLETFTLLIPDGSWAQSAKMIRHIPSLEKLPRIQLPRTAVTSEYKLRKTPHAHHLSTLEGVARFLGLTESPQIQFQLEEVQRLMVSRTLRARGKM